MLRSLVEGGQPRRADDHRFAGTAGLRGNRRCIPQRRLETGARDRLALLRSGLNVDDPTSLTETHQAARELILATPIPAEIGTQSRTRTAASETMSPSRCGRQERPRMPATARLPE